MQELLNGNAGGDLVATGISKHYGAVTALKDASITLEAGKVHALVGENGAGKSTLAKVIAGVIAPDSGTLTLHGTPLELRTPRDAISAGIVAIAQELTVVPTLTVAENVFLGAEPATATIVRRTSMKQRFREVVALAGFDLDPSMIVGNLPTAEKQKVEILRALSRNAKVLIMDEPSASLSSNEVVVLHRMIRHVASTGVAVLLISHFLKEVLELSDTITTLRDGQVISTQAAADCTEAGLIEGMLGRTYSATYPPKVIPDQSSPVVLEVDHISAPGVHEVSMQVRAGEIVGIAGLVGAGRSECVRAIFRDASLSGGSVTMGTETLTSRSPKRSIARGLAFIPESRKEMGLLLDRSIRDNTSLSRLPRLSKWSWIRSQREATAVSTLVAQVGVKASSTAQAARMLSGGNQQKVLFARTLLCEPRVLLCDEPTRGVDVGSKRAIYDLLVAKAQEGMGVVVVSSELEEIIGLAHRVYVMRHGRVSAVLEGDDINESAILAGAFADPATSEGK